MSDAFVGRLLILLQSPHFFCLLVQPYFSTLIHVQFADPKYKHFFLQIMTFLAVTQCSLVGGQVPFAATLMDEVSTALM
jgi:hypothetical protein